MATAPISMRIEFKSYLCTGQILSDSIYVCIQKRESQQLGLVPLNPYTRHRKRTGLPHMCDVWVLMLNRPVRSRGGQMFVLVECVCVHLKGLLYMCVIHTFILHYLVDVDGIGNQRHQKCRTFHKQHAGQTYAHTCIATCSSM